MNNRPRRINKKKAIPLCFQKSHSNSQFLATANYKHQIKKLKKVNKELACSLQDLKCRAADQERALAECTRENTHSMFVKMKLKDVVETVKKLVDDLGEIYDVMDGKSFDFLKNLNGFHQEARLRIRNPSISTIEESASASIIEPELNKEESLSVENSKPLRVELPTTTPSLFDADSSQTEIYNVPLVLAAEQKLRNVSNGNQSAVARSNKSLERTASLPLDPDSPPTPQPPVLPPNFQLSIESHSSIDISKLKPITSQISAESQRSAVLSKLHPVTPTIKNIAKSTISKIPLKKPTASTSNNSSLLEIPSHMNRRKTFVVDKKVEKFLSVSDQSDTNVLNSVGNDAKSDKISDQTLVLSPLPDNAMSDIISDRRGTFVLNSLTNDTKTDEVLDRRATYFIPSQSKEQPDISPPKVVEINNPVQNAVPNQTILLCEDMELTEILPLQNQSHEFIPIVPLWNEKRGLNEKLPASVGDQFLFPNSLVKHFPALNINSSSQFGVTVTQGEDVKNVQIQSTVSEEKDAESKLIASNNLKTTSPAETSSSHQDLKPTDLQQKGKEMEVAKKTLKKENMNTNMVCSAKALPSPIANYVNPDISIQHKIFESFSAVNSAPDKNEPTSNNALVAEKGVKKSTTSKISLSTDQLIDGKMTVKESDESPRIRRSGRKHIKDFANFLLDSDESDISFDKDFIPEKRFSLKPGRKIINPNNNKVFVFKKNSKKQSTDKDGLVDSSTDKSVEENIKNDNEKDIFNFSASSEASKSPVTKSKKRKSVMPKNKRSVNKQSEGGKRLSKASKRSSKPEISKDDVPVTALPRKSILSSNKVSSPLHLKHSSQFSRKSVRFTLFEIEPQDEIENHKCDLPNEENLALNNHESDAFHNIENVSTHRTRSSQGKGLSGNKKSTSARSNSLIATGDILKSSCAKSKRSRKRQSCDLNLDSPKDVCESGCSPQKKASQVSHEIPSPKIETYTDLSCGKQEKSKDVKEKTTEKEKKSGLPKQDTNVKAAGSPDEVKIKDVIKVKRPFSGLSERRSNKKQSVVKDLLPSEVPEETPIEKIIEKNTSEVLSESPQKLDTNIKVTGSTDEIEGTNNKAKRPFSGVSERRSNKKQSIVDELFPSLDSAICEMVDGNKEAVITLIDNEITEMYNVKEMTKSVETDYTKGNSVTIKTPKQKNGVGKKKSSKKRKTPCRQSKDKENIENNTEYKLDALTSDNNLDTLLGFKECLEKTVKSKSSRKKKESALLPQNDIKDDVLTSENATGFDEAVSGRSRRHRAVVSFKEPKLNTKMRRE